MDVREFESEALALDGAESVAAWGHPTFRVHGKIFASLPEPGVGVVKATPTEQAALTASDGSTFTAAPRVGRFGWVRIRLRDAERAQVRELIEEAWRRTALTQLVAGVGGRFVGGDEVAADRVEEP